MGQSGVRLPPVPLVTWLGMNTLFIYLYHPLILALMERTFGREPWVGAGLSLLTLIGLGAVQRGLGRWAMTRTLFLGQSKNG